MRITPGLERYLNRIIQGIANRGMPQGRGHTRPNARSPYDTAASSGPLSKSGRGFMKKG